MLWPFTVFICFYNFFGNMQERFTPLYAIAYALMNSMENLRFGIKETI